MESLEEKILKLEKDLLLSSTRKSAEKISEILDEEFIEFTSSGTIYHYEKGDIYQNKDDKTELDWIISDFKIKELSDECILATYRVIKNNGADESKKYTLRSSIWKHIGGKWKMIFHQGTLCKKF
ncbi:MAG TPA: DUF4440 domain-containing protein [Clostridium sp.]|nr:DUF4440 domain-containing protein [Clostridium sp.]